MSTRAPKVLIMAGGTGGHVFPALATAEKLQRQGVVVEWLGSRTGIENEIVPKAGIPLHRISVTGLRGKGRLSLLLKSDTASCVAWFGFYLVAAIGRG